MYLDRPGPKPLYEQAKAHPLLAARAPCRQAPRSERKAEVE